MNEDLGRTITLFLLWWFLFLVPTIVGSVVGGLLTNCMDYGITAWSLLAADVLIAIVFLGKRYVKLSFGRIEKRWFWPSVGLSVVIAVAFLLFLESFYQLIDFDHLFQEAIEQSAEHARNFYSGIAGILVGCFFGPLAEEIGFRGILLSGLLKTQRRPWLAILMSALCFGLIHGLIAFPSASLFGILVGWLYWRTGSIIPGLIIHVVNNSLSFIDLRGLPHTVCLLILVGCLLLLALVLWWFGKKFSFAKHQHFLNHHSEC